LEHMLSETESFGSGYWSEEESDIEDTL